MFDKNPYVAPEPVNDLPVPFFSSGGASLIWLAGTFASIAAIVSCYVAMVVYGYGDAASVFVHALLPTAVLTVPAVAMYGLARFLFHRKLRYTSTPISLVLAGAILACIMTSVYFFGSMAMNEPIAWGVSVLVAFGFCYIVCAIERLVTASAVYKVPTSPSSPTSVESSASIFWFSTGCLVFGFFAGAAMQTPGFNNMLAGGVITAALLCLIGTAAYGAASVCVRRSKPATVYSRIAAAFVFTVTISLFGFLMEFNGMPPGIARLLIIIPIAPLSVWVDRLVGGRRTASRGRSTSAVGQMP